VSAKWDHCCRILDNLIDFDGSGVIEGLSLINILERTGITDNLDQILAAVESRNEQTGEPLTKGLLETNLFATVQQFPTFPLDKIFEMAIQQDIDHQVILIIGLLGRGKSALSQFLVTGEHDSESDDTFISGEMGHNGGGVTTDFWIGHYPLMGNTGTERQRFITVIDTPGGNDENIPNFENFKRLQSVIKRIRFINTILLVVSPQDIMRRTETLNTYLQEFALMMQQKNLAANTAVCVTRGNTLIPVYFPNVQRFEQALEQSVLNPLTEAFGDSAEYFMLSLAKADYMVQPELEEQTKERLLEIYTKFMQIKAIDCQQMVSLETRIRLLIQKHVALETEHKQMTEDLSQTKETLAETEKDLEETQNTLSETEETLHRTAESLDDTKDALDREKKNYDETFLLLQAEREERQKYSEQLEAERMEHGETRLKWENEVEEHHQTQFRLETEIRNHKTTKTDLETKDEMLEENRVFIKTTKQELEAEQQKLEEARKDIEKLNAKNRKLESKKGGCIIS